MEPNVIRHGNHGRYAYSFHTSESYNFDSHIHSCYEFLHIIEGTFFYTVEGNEYVLSPGDMIVTSPDELHSFSFPEQCTYTRQFLHIYPSFVADFSNLLLKLDNRIPGTYNYIPAVLFDKYHLEDIFTGLRQCCAKPDANTDFMVWTYALQLIVKLGTIIQNENLSASESRINKNIYQIRKYIDLHFRQRINLDEISEYTFLNKSYLCRLFKQETGMTIRTYLNMRRIVYAKNMILAGRKASTVYTECGFREYSTFYRAFQKYVGMTPEAFKKSHLLQAE